MIRDRTGSPIVWIWTLNDVVKRFFHYAMQTLQDLVKNRNNYTCVCYFVDFDWLIFLFLPSLEWVYTYFNWSVNQTRRGFVIFSVTWYIIETLCISYLYSSKLRRHIFQFKISMIGWQISTSYLPRDSLYEVLTTSLKKGCCW